MAAINGDQRLVAATPVLDKSERFAVGEIILGPGHLDQMSAWAEAMELWLESRRSENTRRSYRRTWEEFLGYTQKAPWQIGRADVSGWVAMLHKMNLAASTIQLKLAAISSFYEYAAHDYTVVRPDGREAALFERQNPAGGKSLREKVNPYKSATCLSAEETRALLRAIPLNTVQGLRDYALFLMYIATGRRNSEVRTLRWGDFQPSNGRIFYKWSGKGKLDEKYELPKMVWRAINAYLHVTGRGELGEKDYVFTALTKRAARLRKMDEADYDPYARPLSMREVGRLLKVYCKRAGLDPTKVHVHTLRHTAATLRRLAGDPVDVVSAFLGHSGIAITQVYLHALDGKTDESWCKVETLLGLGE